MKLMYCCKILILVGVTILFAGCSTLEKPDSTITPSLAGNSPDLYSVTFDNEPLETVLSYYCTTSGRTLLMSPDTPDVLSKKISLRAKALKKHEILAAIETVVKMNGIDLSLHGEKYVKVAFRK